MKHTPSLHHIVTEIIDFLSLSKKSSKSLSEVESSHCTWYFKTAICYTSVLLNATNQLVEETVILIFLNKCVFHFFHSDLVEFWSSIFLVRISLKLKFLIYIVLIDLNDYDTILVSKKVEFFAFLSFCKRMLWKISQISWLVKISTLLSAGNHRRFCFSFT